MVDGIKARSPKDYEEESRPFDDVMREILQAKPKHKVAPKPKARKGGKSTSRKTKKQ